MCKKSLIITKTVEKGEKLCGKNNRNGQMLSSPYCILTVLGKDGTPSTASKERKTVVVKDTLDPTWGETFKVYVDIWPHSAKIIREVGREECSGIKVVVWDKHRVRSDKFMVWRVLSSSKS